MAKTEFKDKARRMRGDGESYNEIASKLGISAGTVSLWCRDIELDEMKIRALESRMSDPNYGRRWKYLKKIKDKKQMEILQNRKIGNNLIGKLNKRDEMIAGTALYWAEGFKKDKMVGFSNTDPEMVKFIIKWLIDCLRVAREDLKLRVVVNESHKYRIEEITDYWSKITGVPSGDFYKPTYQKVNWRKVYDNPGNYYGVLRVRVLKSTNLLRKILGMCQGIRA